MIRGPGNDPKNLILLIGSTLAMLLGVSGAVGLFFIAAAGMFVSETPPPIQAWVLAGSFAGLALLSLPPALVAIRAMRGTHATMPTPSLRAIYITTTLIPISLIAGTIAFQANFIPVILGPPAHLLAALLPLLSMSMITFRQFPRMSQRRAWGHFMAGLWLSPVIALFVELLAAVPFALILLNDLAKHLGKDFFLKLVENPGFVSDDRMIEVFLEVVSQPIYIVLFLVYLGILVPVLEEAIKAIGLLPLWRRKISSAEGFAGGLLAGAGYGLFEALYLGQPGPGWAALMIARAGASMMHMLTAGWTGLGFARTKITGRAGPLIRHYVVAVGLHAVWNVAALVMGVGMASPVLEFDILSPGLSNAMAIGGALFLLVLSAAAYFSLRRLPGRLLSSHDDEHQQLSANLLGVE